MKFKVDQLQVLDAILKQLAYHAKEERPRNPQLVIKIDDQFVAGDYYPKYVNGLPMTYVEHCSQGKLSGYTLERVPTAITYKDHISDFYLKDFGSRDASIKYLFDNPSVLFEMLHLDKYLNIPSEDSEASFTIYRPRFLGNESLALPFLPLDISQEYEVVSLTVEAG